MKDTIIIFVLIFIIAIIFNLLIRFSMDWMPYALPDFPNKSYESLIQQNQQSIKEINKTLDALEEVIIRLQDKVGLEIPEEGKP